jgi:hypothetical protein
MESQSNSLFGKVVVHMSGRQQFDYIIAEADSACSVLASRLSLSGELTIVVAKPVVPDAGSDSH